MSFPTAPCSYCFKESQFTLKSGISVCKSCNGGKDQAMVIKERLEKDLSLSNNLTSGYTGDQAEHLIGYEMGLRTAIEIVEEYIRLPPKQG